MKKLITLLAITLMTISCSQKYETHYTIKKRTFRKGQPHNPVTPKMVKGRRETQEFCTGQFFWYSNAKKATDGSLPALINYSCPKNDYLMDTKITETWWTTIIYSRSCIELESYCPIKLKQ